MWHLPRKTIKLNTNSGADGCHGNWVCHMYSSSQYTLLPSWLDYFCNSCNECIQATNSMDLPHECVQICTACETQPAAITSKTDAEPLCMSGDACANLANTLAHNHVRVPIAPFSSPFYKPSSNYLEELTDTMLEIENHLITSTTDEVDQDETDSWLLLEPDNYNNQSGFSYSKELDESFNIVEYNSCTEYRYQDQDNQQQLYCANQGDDGSDGIAPVQSSEVKEQEEQRQQHQQNVYFNWEYETSKDAFMNTTSSNQIVPKSGILPNATISDVSSSNAKYPQGATNPFPNFAVLMPLQFKSMSREAKILRYREKRKDRKFEKKIRYASRKACAETRPRIKGKFARNTEMDFEVDEMFSTEDCEYGTVPSY